MNKAVIEAVSNVKEQQLFPGLTVKMTRAKMILAPYGFPRECMICGRIEDVLKLAKMTIDQRSKYIEMHDEFNLAYWIGVSPDYIMLQPEKDND